MGGKKKAKKGKGKKQK